MAKSMAQLLTACLVGFGVLLASAPALAQVNIKDLKDRKDAQSTDDADADATEIEEAAERRRAKRKAKRERPTCPAGKVGDAAKGQCCWPGQKWFEKNATCIGAPTCPDGFVAEGGTSCQPAPADVWDNRQACEAGKASECGILGRALLDGLGDIQPDESRGLSLLIRACDGADSESCAFLSDVYTTGGGVPRDPKLAAKFAAKACAAGDTLYCEEDTEVVADESPIVHVEPSKSLMIVGWVALGIGVAAAGTGTALHVVAEAERDEVLNPEMVNGRVSGMTQSTARQKETNANRLDTVAAVTLAIGGVAVLTGATLLIVDAVGGENDESGELSLSLAPDGAAISTSWRF